MPTKVSTRAQIGDRVELFDESCRGSIIAIPHTLMWHIQWDDDQRGWVHPLDVTYLGGPEMR